VDNNRKQFQLFDHDGSEFVDSATRGNAKAIVPITEFLPDGVVNTPLPAPSAVRKWLPPIIQPMRTAAREDVASVSAPQTSQVGSEATSDSVLKINITYDASCAVAPAGFKTAIEAAVKWYEDTFAVPITINITVGWGKLNGKDMPDGALGVSTPAAGISLTYTELRNALWQDARTPDAMAAALALPLTDPTSGGTIFLSSAEAKALGLVNPLGSQVDGYLALDSAASYTFDPNNRAVAGCYDAIATIEHEISHILGRLSYLGEGLPDGSGLFSGLDLFRYNASGVLAPASAATSFCFDGRTLLLPFNDPENGGTSSDWSETVHGDAFCAFAEKGVQDQISATDYSLMDVLGYHRMPVMPEAPLDHVPTEITGAYGVDTTIAAGQAFRYAYIEKPQYSNVSAITLTNEGTVYARLNFGGDAVSTGYSGGAFNGTFVNSRTGIVVSRYDGEYYEANAVRDGFGVLNKVVNAGLIEAVCSADTQLNPFAYGIRTYRNSAVQVVNQASGTISAWSEGYAYGVLLGWGGSVDNAGLITVTGSGHNLGQGADGRAIAVCGVNSLNNSGVIQAKSLSSLPSVAVYMPQQNGDWAGGYRPPVITNSGTIIGDYAIQLGGVSGGPFSKSEFGTITNSGTIIGTVDLWYGKEKVVNSGVIAGSIYFGNAEANYDGSCGHLFGDIYLGLGVNTVRLGNGGEIVRGGGKADNITGGSGNDFIDINRGNNAIDAGAGFDTLSLASASRGYSVDLSAGTVIGAGISTIANFEQVIGTDYSDVLKAGAAGAVLYGGAGSDTLVGGAGNDTLIAGPGGGDIVTTGGGTDTVIYTVGDGRLIVTDYGAGDRIKIFGYSAASAIVQSGADVLVTLSATDNLLLKNTTVAAVTGLSYVTDPYPGLSVPYSQAKFGSSTVVFNCRLPIYSEEIIEMDLGNRHATSGLEETAYGFCEDTLYSLDDMPILDNSGNVRISGDVDKLIGIVGDITNQAGGRFEVVNTGGQGLLANGMTLNSGFLSLNAKGFARGFYNESNGYSLINNSSGVIAIISQTDNATGLQQSPATPSSQEFSNDGSITITAAKDACAVKGMVFSRFKNTGSVIVTAGGAAMGFDSGEHFVNSGNILITGQTAVAVKGAWSFENSGTITVTSRAGAAPSVAVQDLTEGFNNSGTITADYALHGQTGSTVTNSGAINGAILFATGDHSVTNTGTLHGDVYGGEGALSFNSMGAHFSGAVHLEGCSGVVTLGLDGATVYGSGVSDAITGGDGDDFFVIAAGSNAIDGGGGFNTLMLCGSPLGCIVNLSTGLLLGLGDSAISNIQQVVGSTFDDTLTAGAAAATLIGNGGNDTLIGGAGDDVLVASSGGATMVGGGGSDTFIYTAGDHQLVISDFVANADVLQIFGYTTAVSMQQQGADTLVMLSDSDTILLRNVEAGTIGSHQIVYSASAYIGPILPVAEPFLGNATVTFNSAIAIRAGQKLTVDGVSRGLFDASTSISGYALSSLDNAGIISITNTSDVTGLYCDESGYYNRPVTQRPVSRFTNEAGAIFSVSSSSGAATGMAASSLAPEFLNSGNFSVSAAGAACGAASHSYFYGTAPQMVNAVGGNFAVSSRGGDATGMEETAGADIENDGVLTVNAAANAVGILSIGGAGDVVNSGTIDVTSAANWSFGVVFSGQELYEGKHAFTNTGTITAATAIRAGSYPGTIYDFAGQAPNLDVNNSGTINGNVDFGGSICTLKNTGVINGDIRLHADDPAASDKPWITWAEDIVDLRGGTLNGAVVITPGLLNNVVGMRATIYTGSGNALVKIVGGQSALNATIIADRGGHTTVQYDIASIQAGWQRNANGSWTVSAGTDGTEILTNVQTIAFTDRSVSLPPAKVVFADFDNTGSSDVIWQNDDGTPAIWTMDGFQQLGGSPVGGNPGTSWHIKGAGDFNGDGYADILWQNDSGAANIWTMNGFNQLDGSYVGGNPGTSWHIKGTGDFNGDGKSDILWQNDNGQAAIWTMDGLSQLGGSQVGINPGADWHIKGTGDFNGDGKSDILWQNDNGQAAIWLMDGFDVVSGSYVGGNPGTDWRVIGAGDFDSDGRSDILWQNDNGQAAIWTMNGLTQTGGSPVGGNPGASWQAKCAGDYDGDGCADILWQNDNGQAAIWTMSGLTQTGGSLVGGNPGTSWHIPAGVG
jgi:Ca2+-binding RTX toxin-like protein